MRKARKMAERRTGTQFGSAIDDTETAAAGKTATAGTAERFRRTLADIGRLV